MGQRMSDAASAGPPRPTTLASLIAVGLVFASLVGLGTWQLQRKTWKNQLLADIEARGQRPPVAQLAGLLAGDPQLTEYRRVALPGRFDHSAERHIFIAVPRQPNGLGGPGYWVFTPFLTTGGSAGQWIYVNRGFVPEAGKAAAARAVGQTGGDVVIEGRFRQAEVRGRFSAENDVAGNRYYVRAPAELTGRDGRVIMSHYIDQTGPLPAGNLPFPLVGKITISNRHLEYALTWYALAATWLVIAGLRLRPRG
jgi:surfeit locus 1 family protein